MATEKQIAANGRNAQKSTGPRTSEGKARAAHNSFKHGLLAKPALLPDESGRAFREFMKERIRELAPVGALESDLAEQIVVQLWRLRRFPRVEAGLFIGDRAERDLDYFGQRVAQFEKREPPPYVQRMNFFDERFFGSSEVEITDEVRHAEAAEMRSAAADAKRSELALLGAAFSSAAVKGDPFSKLSRYETAAVNRLRHLIADFAELQARRESAQIEDAAEERAAS
jgi:hypothetical protein